MNENLGIERPIVEKGIPIPPKRTPRRLRKGATSLGHRGPNRGKYPFLEMEIGDSFWTPTLQNAISHSVGYTTDRYKMKFSTRRDADGPGGRIWRIQ